MQADVERSATAAVSRMSAGVAPNTECGPSATCTIARGPRSWWRHEPLAVGEHGVDVSSMWSGIGLPSRRPRSTAPRVA